MVLGIRRDWFGVWGGAILLAILFWPQWPMVPQPGLDPSWQTGLAWATQIGLQWGTDVAFTYGPLGFAQDPWLASNAQILIASVQHVGACVALVSLAYLLVGRTHAFSPVRAAGIACAASALCLAVGVWSTLFAVVVMAGLLGLVTTSMGPLILGGVASALMAQGKVSEAVAAAGFIILCGLGAGRLRGATIVGGTIAVAWIVSWLLLGQQIGHIGDQVAAVAQVITGYSQAMSSELPGYQWHYDVVIPIALLLLVQLRYVIRDWQPLPRVAIVLAILWVLWLAFRSSFTRHDDAHDAGFFSIVIILSVGLLITMIPRRPTWAGAAAVSLCYLYIAFVFGLVAIVDRTDGIRRLARVVSVTANSEVRAQEWNTAIQVLVDSYRLTPELIAEIGTGPAFVDPWDISALVPTNARWDPLPVLQGYAAYTPELDALNARDLRARPRTILRSVPYEAIDGRNPMWESPTYQLAVYCDYSVGMATARWQILRPMAATRCGQPEDAGTVTARAGESVTVPFRPGSVTVVDILSAPATVDRLLSLLFKSRSLYVSYGSDMWRVAESPDAIGLMLNAPVPHAAFGSLPVQAYPSIQSSRDSQFVFRFVPVQADSAIDDRSTVAPP